MTDDRRAPQHRSPASGRLSASIVPQRALTVTQRAELWSLFVRYHGDVLHEIFARDLAEKDHVILLHDSGDRTLCGFSTLKTWEDGGVSVIFSGDTIVEAAYWGQPALRLAFLRYALGVKLSRPLRPLYWLLCAKTVQTYLLLTRFFPEHWPRQARPMPARMVALRDRIAARRYGAAYDAERGVLMASPHCGALRADVAQVSTGARPEVSFFLAQNPAHKSGAALCCLGRLDLSFALGAPLRLALHAIEKLRRRGAVPEDALADA